MLSTVHDFNFTSNDYSCTHEHTNKSYGEKIPLLSDVLDTPGLKNLSCTKHFTTDRLIMQLVV
jgi:hypothetical protein